MKPGQNILHYRLVEQIGEGGMGVVWKALDTTLNREVAIKVLPDIFAQDPERLARFEREARLLASLNHANIATLHGLHVLPADGADPESRFLAMELVEGEDLASRLSAGALPMEEALTIASQIAAALEAAHARGVIHRDLKPANVVLTPGPSPQAKVLDFGLAKLVNPESGDENASATGDLSRSPTVTSLGGTQAGVILGTAAYMSPEQARGRAVDQRTDIWSFGCVLYECLTGKKLFAGETVSDSLAAILRKDVDWSALPEDTPPMVRVLLHRCLTRDPAKRKQDAGDTRIDLEQSLEDPRGKALGLAAGSVARADGTSRIRSWLPWLLAAAFALAAGLSMLPNTSPSLQPASVRHLTMSTPGPTSFGTSNDFPPTISPDGRHVVFGAYDDAGQTQLWLRAMDNFQARPLAGTRGAQMTFWSPDSRHIGFFLRGSLMRIEIESGQTQTIGDVSSYAPSPRGASWGANGLIVYSPDTNSGIHVIDSAGGPSRPVTTPDPDIPDSSHRWPWLLPDGDHFLFLQWTNDLRSKESHAGIAMGSISSGEVTERLLADASNATFIAPGHLLVVRNGNLIALPLDPDSMQVTGDPVMVAVNVRHSSDNGLGTFSVSNNGVIVYQTGEAVRPLSLSWYDREGSRTDTSLEPAPFIQIRLAQTSQQALAAVFREEGDAEIRIMDLARGVTTPLFESPWWTGNPIWSGDEKQLLYESQETGPIDFYVRRSDGSGQPEPILVDGGDKALYDWSSDGDLIAYGKTPTVSTSPNIWLYHPESGEDHLFVSGSSYYQDARFSPNGRWLAFVQLDDSGQGEVLVQAIVRDGDVVRAGARYQVSLAGGNSPHWRNDGGELIYIDGEQRLMAVDVEDDGERLVMSVPRALFSVQTRGFTGDATADHQRFLLGTPLAQESNPLHVILNWTAGL